ncbi:MAG: hypothetical protein EBU80_13845 [Chitinophagia bacterium]|nr:hypothetical protein [Chitinophagia bacterium]
MFGWMVRPVNIGPGSVKKWNGDEMDGWDAQVFSLVFSVGFFCAACRELGFLWTPAYQLPCGLSFTA